MTTVASIKVCDPVSVPLCVLEELQQLRAQVEQLRRENERLLQENERLRRELEEARTNLDQRSGDYSFSSARSRLVCTRLTGISVCFLSSMRNWKLDLNQGITSLIRLMFTRNERCTRQNTSGSRLDCSSSMVR